MTCSVPAPKPTMEKEMYGYPPPFWGYPQQSQNMNMDQNALEKGMRIALKISQREAREKERLDNKKKRDRDEERKRVEAARQRSFTSLEWFIIGVIMYPIVGPLYNLAIHNLQNMVK
jgi:hypothetical protein